MNKVFNTIKTWPGTEENNMRPWYRIVWNTAMAIPFILALLATCLFGALIFLDIKHGKTIWKENVPF